jgi:hypothetical protein
VWLGGRWSIRISSLRTCRRLVGSTPWPEFDNAEQHSGQ